MMSDTRSTPQLNWSSARYSPDRLEATACMVTVAPSATARTVTRARSPLTTSSRISLSHKLTTTADSPAASVPRTAETDGRRPARRAKSANAPTTRRASVTEALGLEQEQLGVAAVGGEQFGVASVLDNPAAVQDTDPIGVADRREAVGDEDRGQATGQVEEVLEERGLGADVEVRGRLVQHQDAGPGVDREQRAGRAEDPVAEGSGRALLPPRAVRRRRSLSLSRDREMGVPLPPDGRDGASPDASGQVGRPAASRRSVGDDAWRGALSIRAE